MNRDFRRLITFIASALCVSSCALAPSRGAEFAALPPAERNAALTKLRAAYNANIAQLGVFAEDLHMHEEILRAYLADGPLTEIFPDSAAYPLRDTVEINIEALADPIDHRFQWHAVHESRTFWSSPRRERLEIPDRRNAAGVPFSYVTQSDVRAYASGEKFASRLQLPDLPTTSAAASAPRKAPPKSILIDSREEADKRKNSDVFDAHQLFSAHGDSAKVNEAFQRYLDLGADKSNSAAGVTVSVRQDNGAQEYLLVAGGRAQNGLDLREEAVFRTDAGLNMVSWKFKRGDKALREWKAKWASLEGAFYPISVERILYSADDPTAVELKRVFSVRHAAAHSALPKGSFTPAYILPGESAALLIDETDRAATLYIAPESDLAQAKEHYILSPASLPIPPGYQSIFPPGIHRND